VVRWHAGKRCASSRSIVSREGAGPESGATTSNRGYNAAVATCVRGHHAEHGRRADGQRRRACLSALLDALAVGVDESNLVLRKVGRRELSIHVTHGEHLIRCGVRVHCGPRALSPMFPLDCSDPASNYDLTSACPRELLAMVCAQGEKREGARRGSPLRLPFIESRV